MITRDELIALATKRGYLDPDAWAKAQLAKRRVFDESPRLTRKSLLSVFSALSRRGEPPAPPVPLRSFAASDLAAAQASLDAMRDREAHRIVNMPHFLKPGTYAFVDRAGKRIVMPPITPGMSFVWPAGTAKADPAPRTTKRQHREAIAAKAQAEPFPYLGNDTDVLVSYRGHECVYSLAGDRPRFLSRNSLAKTEEPRKIVQDGMRLAAIRFYAGSKLQEAEKSIHADMVDDAMANVFTDCTFDTAHEWPAVQDGVDLGTEAGDSSSTTIWYKSELLTFADIDQGDGKLLCPDSFAATPHFAGWSYSQMLEVWAILAAAARWNK